MKQWIAVALVVILTGCDNGSIFNSDTAQMKSDKVGRLEAQDLDLRVYEFTPQTSPGVQCVFVAGTNKAGMSCFPKVQP